MEDAVRPDKKTFRAMYERAYRTWLALRQATDGDTHLSTDCLSRLDSAFPDHPFLPENLSVDTSFPGRMVVKGTTTWKTTQVDDLESFKDEMIFWVASNRPTTIVLTSKPRHLATILPGIFDTENNHTPILMLAWTYILASRWAELIPEACPPTYGNLQRPPSDFNADKDGPSIKVDVGDACYEAVLWWTAVLSVEGGGWQATVCNKKGNLLHSPWATVVKSERRFSVSSKYGSQQIAESIHPASCSTALRYLSQYCDLHGLAMQSKAALSAALLIPTAHFDGSHIELPTPSLKGSLRPEERVSDLHSTIKQKNQLDRLMTLSCNARGVKALLTSIFFEPDVTSNICGAWLQGSFAYLDQVKDPYALLKTLMKRNEELGFLWLGAFITGTHAKCLREARAAWWKVDINIAGWTGTFMSFIQEQVPELPFDAREISRANECRLLYLSHDINYRNAPLFPFAPFGATAMEDTNLEVRQHALCRNSHQLQYESFTWDCLHGQKTTQPRTNAPVSDFVSKHKHFMEQDGSMIIDFDDLDSEDESSEMVTRNIFTWLRDEDGFPVAEREIREHEWIDNLDSDGDSLIEGDACSTFSVNLHGWLSKTTTQRSLSI
ncbi:hypothetical protein G7046_g5566 [Stylonectria norvegica]|nr:hypothetical protein G7046_g5566 [Stylonectria norvegica]